MQYITREALHVRVWKEPLVRLAPLLGTSSPALKQLCLQAAIPLPGAGHWSKLRSGKAATPQPLPCRPPGAWAVIAIGQPSGWWRGPREMLVDPVPPEPDFPETLEAMAVRVAGDLTPLTKPTSIWPPRNTSAQMRRRLQILSDLRVLLAQFVAHPELVEEAPEAYRTQIHAVSVRFTLREIGSSPEHLSLCVQEPPRPGSSGGRVFDHSAGASLETQLPAIAIDLLVRAEATYRDWAWRLYEARMRSRREAEEDVRLRHQTAVSLVEQRRRDRQQARRDHLFSQAHAWRTAQDIRGFVADALAATPAGDATIALEAWAEWARREADELDPVQNRRLKAPDRLEDRSTQEGGSQVVTSGDLAAKS